MKKEEEKNDVEDLKNKFILDLFSEEDIEFLTDIYLKYDRKDLSYLFFKRIIETGLHDIQYDDAVSEQDYELLQKIWKENKTTIIWNACENYKVSYIPESYGEFIYNLTQNTKDYILKTKEEYK